MGAPVRIGILAGESSGDILGADLMQALLARNPDVVFEGIGGPLMAAQGLQSRVPMERLSVMGLVEPLKRLPELLRKRRLHKIAKAVDLVLTLFPFEADFYAQHRVPVCFVGHPLADRIPLQPDRAAARLRLGLGAGKVVALLPGSRLGEVGRLAPAFLQAAVLMSKRDSTLQFLLPAATSKCRELLEALPQLAVLRSAGTLHLLDGNSRLAMEAADAVLLASGTATLEAMLLKLPMLVCYRMAPLSYAIISRLLKVPYFSLPNLLAGEKLVDELVQDQVEPHALADKMHRLLQEGEQTALQSRYIAIHQTLRREASQRAADAIFALL